jgi:hypothetical protein
MQTGLLHLHSFLRWVILVFLVISIGKSYICWQNKKVLTANIKGIWLITLIAAHITLLLGLYQWLFGRYGVLVTSPPVGVSVMKDKFYRFYWVEHPTGMIIAIILITLGYGMAKKPVSDEIRFKKAFWYFTIALLVILVTVPWPFREIIGRPLIPGMH